MFQTKAVPHPAPSYRARAWKERFPLTMAVATIIILLVGALALVGSLQKTNPVTPGAAGPLGAGPELDVVGVFTPLPAGQMDDLLGDANFQTDDFTSRGPLPDRRRG